MQKRISHNLVIFIDVTKLGQSNENPIEEFFDQFFFTLNHPFNGFTSQGTIHPHTITAAESITEIGPTHICGALPMIPVLSRTFKTETSHTNSCASIPTGGLSHNTELTNPLGCRNICIFTIEC
jgi:hypothetical protein